MTIYLEVDKVHNNHEMVKNNGAAMSDIFSAGTPRRQPMAYDEEMAQRVREVLSGHPVADGLKWDEIRMFGGLCFTVNGHMTCGVTADGMMVRVGKEQYEDALAQPHAREMDFTGRPMTGMVYVSPEGVEGKAALRRWVERGVRFTASLPPKKKKTNAKKAAGKKETPKKNPEVNPFPAK